MKLIMSQKARKEMKNYFEKEGYKVTMSMIDTWLEEYKGKVDMYYMRFDDFVHDDYRFNRRLNCSKSQLDIKLVLDDYDKKRLVKHFREEGLWVKMADVDRWILDESEGLSCCYYEKFAETLPEKK